MSAKRYPLGKHPAYDEIFNHFKLKSHVLNSSSPSNKMNQPLIDQKSYEYELHQLKGDRDGNINVDDYNSPSRLKQAENALEEAESAWETHKQLAINGGRAEPKVKPKNIQDEIHKAEALVDIRKLEMNHLQRKLDAIKRENKKKHTEACLQYGPIGSGSLRGGILNELDGQNVEKDNKGVLRIADEASPYHGIRTAVYFEKIVKPWAKERSEKEEERRKKGGFIGGGKVNPDKLPKMQQEWIKE